MATPSTLPRLDHDKPSDNLTTAQTTEIIAMDTLGQRPTDTNLPNEPVHCGAATPAYQAIHDAAVANGEISYLDPDTGYLCFTALFHKNRGTCCLSNCRHCPFGFIP